jgi:hypothetical protein
MAVRNFLLGDCPMLHIFPVQIRNVARLDSLKSTSRDSFVDAERLHPLIANSHVRFTADDFPCARAPWTAILCFTVKKQVPVGNSLVAHLAPYPTSAVVRKHTNP